MDENRTITRRFNTFQCKEIRWLWKPFLACGKISVIQGDPASGKTTLALAIAALLTTGRPMPEDNREPLCGEVIYQSAEDNIGDTLNPRLAAMGADCSKISVIEAPFSDIEKDCETLEGAIREVGALYCVLDPLQGFIGKGSDMNRAADMRRLMGGLALVAERTGCAVVAVGHMSKNAGAKSLYRGLGSIDIAASARSVLSVGRSADDDTVRVVTHVKSSLAQEGSPLAFTIGNHSVVEFLGRTASATTRRRLWWRCSRTGRGVVPTFTLPALRRVLANAPWIQRRKNLVCSPSAGAMGGIGGYSEFPFLNKAAALVAWNAGGI